MKKLLVFLCVVLCPVSIMAMSPETDEALADITAQAGVSINPNLTMDMSINTVAWGDKTGVDASSAAGWAQTGTAGYIGITGLNLTGMTVSTQLGVAGVTWKPITIDVATGTAHGTGVTFVRFGLGSLKITMPAQTVGVALGASGSTLTQMLGENYLNLTGLTFDSKSYVDIYSSTSSCGVNMAENLIINSLALQTVSWGDTDGITGVSNSTGGFVGLANLQLTSAANPITITGTMAINIGSNSAYSNAGTVLRVGFTESDYVTNVAGPVTGDLVLDSSKTLDSSNAKNLGDIYVSSFKTTIKNGGYVDIWGH